MAKEVKEKEELEIPDVGKVGIELLKDPDGYYALRAYLIIGEKEYGSRKYSLNRRGAFYRPGILRAETLVDDIRGEMLKEGKTISKKILMDKLEKALQKYYPE